MITCKICNKEFVNNLGGQLTLHLFNDHNITMEEYVIITEYNEIPPICKCGCGEIPKFYRGSYLDYVPLHNSFEHRENQYIKQFGEPICKVCGCLVGFRRAIPHDLCKQCQKTYQYKNGEIVNKIYHFQIQGSQDKVRKSVIEKYGVDNISKVPEIVEKIKETIRVNPRPIYIPSNKERERMSVSAKAMWNNQNTRDKIITNLRIGCNLPEERERRSRVQKERWKNIKQNDEPTPLYKSSKLHMAIREELNLSAYGFVSEQMIDWYVADELQQDKQIIIEINGDFWHANPEKYSETDIIEAPGGSFVAGDKWKQDMLKYKKYIELGYDLIVIWESDYKENKTLATYKEQLKNIFGF